MASLKNIKTKILSYKKTGTVTHAMEAVSAVKMRKAQERALGTRTYAASALTVLERLSKTIDLSKHPLLNVREGKLCIIVITSDKGLAGALNSGVIKRAEEQIRTSGYAIENVVIVAIGRRGAEYFASRGYDVRIRRDNLGDDVLENDIHIVVSAVLGFHAAGEISTCVVAYTNFVSTFEQEPVVRQLVPITEEVIASMVKGIRPAKGKYAPQVEAVKHTNISYTIEPSADAVFAILLPRLLSIAVFHATLESKASEHSARMVAMKSATDKAKDMTKSLTRIFNKVRQAAITREVSEITSGMEAMK
ncbi:MAG: synthase gamma chain [Candidatus Kaiserbacteria bacterium]|nr:synthase gamma chain [Candidatus Kaiserbacteria bacterium]